MTEGKRDLVAIESNIEKDWNNPSLPDNQKVEILEVDNVIL